MERLRFLLFSFVACSWSITWAQQAHKQLQQPKQWVHLHYDMDKEAYYDGSEFTQEYWNIAIKKQDRTDVTWRVFARKADVEVFDKPSGVEIRKYPFSHILWVYDEKDAYVQVGDEKQPVGWVRKSDLILWRTPLVDHATGIEFKAFAANHPRASKRLYAGQESKDSYDVFDQPQGGTKIASHPLYEVLFIFQYAPGVGDAPGRYLVSEHFDLHSGNKLIGWVNDDRLRPWSTNLCLEPNWEVEAIAERRAKQVFAQVFDEGANSERDAYFSGTGKVGGLYKEPRDPAYKKEGVDQRNRLPGFIFRYPVFSGKRDTPDNCVFNTGTPARLEAKYATVSEQNYSQDNYVRTESTYEAMKKSYRNLNVIIVVEGQPGVQKWVNPVIDGLKRVYATENTLSIGAVVYRNDDVEGANEATYINKMDLTPDGKGLKEWLARAPMFTIGDAVDTRPAYLALIRGMGMARTGETNVLVHLTSRPDHSEDPDFNSERPGYRAPKELKEPLMEKDVHYLGFVLPPTDSPETVERVKRTLEQMHATTLEQFAGAISTLVSLHANDMVLAPRRKEAAEDGRSVAYMSPSTLEFRACQLSSGTDEIRFTQWVIADVKKCQKAYEEHFKVLEKLLLDGSPEARKAEAMDERSSFFLLERLCSEATASDADRRACISYSLAQKVHYFLTATTSYRAASLTHPVYKYVLFMPQDRLIDQETRVSALVNTFDDNLAESRIALRQYWEAVAKDILGKSDPKMTLEALQMRMTGVHRMDIILPFKENYVTKELTLNDLNDPKKCTNDMVVSMKKDFVNELENLRKVQKDQELRYVIGDGDAFYWVPIEYLLK